MKIENLTWENFYKYVVHLNLPANERVSTNPEAILEFKPIHSKLFFKFKIPNDIKNNPSAAIPDLIEISFIKKMNEEWMILECSEPSMFVHFYHFGMSVVKINQEISNPVQSFNEAIKDFRILLSTSSNEAITKLLGIWGELLFLRHLISTEGETAVESWTGPINNDSHDFRIKNLEIEVKTTSRNKRIHIINGLSQLQPSPDSILKLLSIQSVPAGLDNGISCEQIFNEINTKIKSKKIKSKLETLIQGTDYHKLKELISTKRKLRSIPKLIEINNDIPSITHTILTQVYQREIISRLDMPFSYAINFEGLGEDYNIKGDI